MKKLINEIEKIFKTKKSIIMILSFLLLTIFYMSFVMNLFFDTGHYMGYVEIFEGKLPFSSWDIVRGPIFPIIIYLSNFLFGKTGEGILLLSFIFYLVMLLFTKKILDRVYRDKDNKKILIVIFSLIILNPIIFGYYHTLLTEFVAMTIAVMMCYLSWKWLDFDYKKTKKEFLFYSLFFMIMSVISWQLKQPYVSVALFPIIISVGISFLEDRSISNILQRGLTVFICICGIILSIASWNHILSSRGIDLNTDRNITASLGNQLMVALNNYEVITDLSKKENLKFLSKSDKKKVTKEDYYLVNVYNLSKKLIDQKIIPFNEKKNGSISTISAFKFIAKEMFDHPILVLESYSSTYLAIADFYPKIEENKKKSTFFQSIDKKIDLDYCNEHCIVALRVLKEQENTLPMYDNMRLRLNNYIQYNKPPVIFTWFLRKISLLAQILYKVSMILLPGFVVLATISFMKRKNKNNKKKLSIILVLLWYSFLHVLLHTVTGANIDRYTAPILVPIVIGMVLYINYVADNFQKRKIRK